MKQPQPQNTIMSKEAKQTAGVLYKLILATTVVYFILLISGLFGNDWKMSAVAGAGILLQVLPFLLIRNGKTFAGSIILMVFVLALLSAFATVGQCSHDIALIGIPVVYIFAGLTLNRVVLRVTIALSIVSIGWLVFGEHYGWFIPHPFGGSPVLFEIGRAHV